MFRRAMQIDSNSSKEIKGNTNFKKELHTLCLKSWDGSWGLQLFFPEPRENQQKQKKPKNQKTKNKIPKVLAGTPPLPESLGILLLFVFWVSLFFCLFDVFGLPRSKSLQILPCLLPGSGDPNDHAYGSAVYVVKSRPSLLLMIMKRT